MKKCLVLVLVCVMVIGTAVADTIDLSGMSFSELLALEKQVQAAMWASDGWQEVKVPEGVYKIGNEIPAGKWTISAVGEAYNRVLYGGEKEGKEVKFGSEGYACYHLYGPKKKDYKDGYYTTSVAVEMEEGFYLSINEGYVVFTPYAGPGFTFK